MKAVRYLFGILISFLIVFPFYWVIVSSLKPADQILKPDLLPKALTLLHYRELLEQTSYLTNLSNSVLVALGTMICSVLIVIPAGYAIYRMKFAGRKLVSRLILATYIFPGTLLLVPVYQMMSDLHLVNSLWGLIVINVTFAAPFSVWLMQGFFDSVPVALDEAAAIDGAGRMRTLLQIILPLIGPGIATISIYAFITSWTEFAFSSVLITSEELRTLPIGLNAIMGQYTVRWGWTTAGAVLTLLPVVIFFAFVGRFFVKGLTAGAVK
ncbi:carbohydrate ABC transporter permease [Paenibacillus sp. S150]|uniref:carbohydrate ABC transporter permease n=1 Tax=Paenibacillus sp. S150 TaxID=2749826 RepID=UPI001C58B4D8|nr:carbohydrate ABC transporter permease [Paenibacillus sp. S150]MBW4084260.1 carbohydrate ABC transporter permease [Paenibacillus sp. S150]